MYEISNLFPLFCHCYLACMPSSNTMLQRDLHLPAVIMHLTKPPRKDNDGSEKITKIYTCPAFLTCF